MIPSSSCPPWQQLDRPGPAGDHDGLAAVTPLIGTRSCNPPPPMLSQALTNGPGRRSAPTPSPFSPARELAGLGGVGKVESSPQFKKSARRKARAIAEGGVGAKVSIQVE